MADIRIPRIERTVNEMKSPTSKEDIKSISQNRTNKRGKINNPNFFKKALQYCDSIFDDNNVSNKGLVVAVSHGFNDGILAAGNLHEFLSEKEYSVVSFHSDDMFDIADYYDMSDMLRVGKKLKYIHKNRMNSIQQIIINVLGCLFTIISAMLTIMGKIDQTISYSVIAAALSITCVLTFFLNRHAKNEEIIQLYENLADLDEFKLEKFWSQVSPSNKRKEDVLILKQFHRFREFKKTGVLNYLKNANDSRQVWFLFGVQSFDFLFKDAIDGFRIACLEIDKLPHEEMIKLKKDYNSNVNSNQFHFHGVDILFPSLNENDEGSGSFQDLQSILNKLGQLGYGCNNIGCLYVLSYITSTYDLYLSIPEMIELLNPCRVKDFQISNIESEIIDTYLMNKSELRKVNYNYLVSKLIDMLGKYVKQPANDTLHYKFSSEIKYCIETNYKDQIPHATSLSRWVLIKLLYTGEKFNVNNLLYNCTKLLSEIAIDGEDEQVLAFSIEVLSILERNHTYFYHHEILEKTMKTIINKTGLLKKYLINPVIKSAELDNLIYSPHEMSWEHHKNYTELYIQYITKKTNDINLSDMDFYKILDMDEKDLGLYLRNMSAMDNKIAFEFYRILNQLFQSTLEGFVSKEARRYFLGITSNKPANEKGNSKNYKVLNEIKGLISILKKMGVSLEQKDIDENDLVQIFVSKLDLLIDAILKLDNINSLPDSYREEIMLLNVIAEYNNLPLLNMLSTLVFLLIKDEYDLISTNQNKTFELITKTFYFMENNFFIPELIDYINLIINRRFDINLRLGLLSAMIVFNTSYKDLIINFLTANIDLLEKYVSEIINADWFTENDLYPFMKEVILLSEKTKDNRFVDIYKEYINKKFGPKAVNIDKYLDIIVNKKVDEQVSMEEFINESKEMHPDIAVLVFSAYCKANYDRYLYLPDLFPVINNSSLFTKDAVMGFYLLHKNVSFEDVDKKIFKEFFSSIRTSPEWMCDIYLEVLYKFGDELENGVRLKGEVNSRLSYIHVVQIQEVKNTVSFPLMAIRYNLLLFRWLYDMKGQIKLINSRPEILSTKGQVTTEKNKFIIENFPQLDAVKDKPQKIINMDYYNALSLVVEEFDVQKELLDKYDLNQLIQCNLFNTRDLLDVLISVYETQPKSTGSNIINSLRQANNIIRNIA